MKKQTLLGALGLLAASVLAAGAAGTKGAKAKGKGASDFSVRYEWRTGTVAPPYQSSYTISLGPGPRGRMVMLPSLSSEPQISRMNVEPVWTESFAFLPATRDKLRATLRARGVFSRSWKEPAPGRRPVGGGSEDLEVRANGRTFSIPAFLGSAQDQAQAQAVYEAINAVVPRAARARLEAKREQYQKQQAR